MELPDDVLGLVHDFSRPVTRPDWRRLRRMPELKFLKLVANTYNEMNLPVINSFVHRFDTRENNYRYTRFDYNPNRITNCYRYEV